MIQYPLIIGHRGASALAPENTIAAFSRALHDGADGIEFDVRIAKDGVPVVIHDADLKRTGKVDRMVRDLTSDELQEIDVGVWFHTHRSSHRARDQEVVPTLIDVFELFKDHSAILYLEMKGEPVRITLPFAVSELVRKYDYAERVIVESFDLAAIAEIKRIDPEIRTAALFEPKLSQRLYRRSTSRVLELAKEVRADEVALHHTLARENLIAEARKSRFEVVVWTVDDSKWVTRAKQLGIKALISNNPSVLLKQRQAE